MVRPVFLPKSELQSNEFPEKYGKHVMRKPVMPCACKRCHCSLGNNFSSVVFVCGHTRLSHFVTSVDVGRPMGYTGRMLLRISFTNRFWYPLLFITPSRGTREEKWTRTIESLKFNPWCFHLLPCPFHVIPFIRPAKLHQCDTMN